MGSMFGDIFSGISQRNADKKEATLADEQLQVQAQQKSRDLQQLQSQQQLSFAKSGVTLDGSPMLVQAETQRQGTQEIQDLLTSGTQQSNAKRQAGRNAFIGSLFKADADAQNDAAKAMAAGG